MKKADWNHYLSDENIWARRLLGLENFSRIRNLDQVEREYNQEKYGNLNSTHCETVEQYVQLQYESAGLHYSQDICMSISEELFKIELGVAKTFAHSVMVNTIKKHHPVRICELGCGYGMNFPLLQSLTPEVYGGEFSGNAVQIAHRLGLDVRPFNYYNLEHYSFIRERSLIFTNHSIEQLPSAQSFIDHLAQVRDNIDVVVQFEPTFLKSRTSLIGLLRNRYIEINDYNRDLILLLQQRDDVEILEFHPDHFGINPLNPSCIVVWKFR